MIVKVKLLNDDALYNKHVTKCLEVGDVYDADIEHRNEFTLCPDDLITIQLGNGKGISVFARRVEIIQEHPGWDTP